MIEIGTCQLCTKADVETLQSSTEAVNGLSFMDLIKSFTSSEVKAETIQLCFKCQEKAILAQEFKDMCNNFNKRLETVESIAQIIDLNPEDIIAYDENFELEEDEETALDQESEPLEPEINVEDVFEVVIEDDSSTDTVFVLNDDKDPEEFHCTICSSSFMSRDNLSRHLFRHNSKPSLKCPYCPRQFYFNRELNFHVKKHLEPSVEYLCEICNKNYSSKSALQKHLKLHTEPKQFKCNFEGCSMKFARKFTLETHLRKHKKEKPFQCPRCSASFIQKNILLKHFRKVHKEHLYKCEYCKEQSFETKAELRVHYQECDEFLETRQ